MFIILFCLYITRGEDKPMKKIFIYYSLTGNGDHVAKFMEARGYEIRKVIEKKKMPKSFFFRVLIGGYRAGRKKKGKLINYDNNIKDYSEIVIGSPVWNGRFPPAINSVLDQTDLSSAKKLAFFFYSGSGETPKVVKEVVKEFPHARIIVTKEPKNNPSETHVINKL